MDLVDYSQDRYNNIIIDFASIAKTLQLQDVTYLPVSALKGDNIVDRSLGMPWYDGPALLELLENTPIEVDSEHERGRLSVQYVIRPQTETHHDYRGYAAGSAAASIAKGIL